jgi:outer membrane lipoprotein-sorting protein
MDSQPTALRDLVRSMYRARWLPCVISGEVRTREENSGYAGEETGTLVAGPGQRFRADLVDEDGEHEVIEADGRIPDFSVGELLAPSWLLADYDLRITGETEYLGRHAVAVTASGHKRSGPHANVTALVDAELGILLRCEKNRPSRLAEFVSMAVAAAERSDGEAADAGRATGPELTDEQVDLLFHTAFEPPELSASMRERVDERAILNHLTADAPGAARRFADLLRESAKDRAPASTEMAGSVAVAMPDRYRINNPSASGGRPVCTACDGKQFWRVYPDRVGIRPAKPLPVGLASMIDPRWLLTYRLEATGMSTVSGRSALTITAFRGNGPVLSQSPFSRRPAPADRIEVAVDAELGIVLRQIRYLGDQPVMQAELSDIATGCDPSVFRIDPPPGTKIITAGLLAESGTSPAALAVGVAKAASAVAVEVGRAAIKSAWREAVSRRKE